MDSRTNLMSLTPYGLCWPQADPILSGPSCPRERLHMVSMEHSFTRLLEVCVCVCVCEAYAWHGSRQLKCFIGLSPGTYMPGRNSETRLSTSLQSSCCTGSTLSPTHRWASAHLVRSTGSTGFNMDCNWRELSSE